MIKKIAAKNRYKAEHGWLTSYHLFSFNMYRELGNMNFGRLRVFNDDYIDGESGFGMHSHDNMEIVTIVHSGTLTHQDSMGNAGEITAGEVQYMSAGTGVTHAELNQQTNPVHLYQIWIFPNSQNEIPKYEQRSYSDMPKNKLVPVASGQDHAGAIPIRSDAAILIATLEANHKISHQLQNDSGLFIYIKKGHVTVNGIELETEDQARITDETDITVTANTDSELVAIETPMKLPF